MEKKTKKNGPYNVTIIYDTPVHEVAPAPLTEHAAPYREVFKKYVSSWREMTLLAAAVTMVGVGVASAWLYARNRDTAPSLVGTVNSEWRDPFLGLTLEAKAAIVFDIGAEKTLYAKNPQSQLPLASLAKLLTALMATETLGDEGIVTIGKEAVEEAGDSGLRVGEKWRAKDLVGLTLLSSSNDGAVALAHAVEAASSTTPGRAAPPSFVELMNSWAEKVGLSQTYFLDASGLDMNAAQSGAYGSARDIAALFSYILTHTPSMVEDTSFIERTFTSLDGIVHVMRNTNDRVRTVPGLVASKTGFTDLAGGNLAIVFEAGPMRPIAVVVLGSSAEGRFSDVETLVEASIDYFRYKSSEEF